MIARTSPEVPPPFESFSVAVITVEGTASRVDDYQGWSRTFTLQGESRVPWVANEGSYVSSIPVAVWPIRDDLDEEDETFDLRLQRLPDLPRTVMFIPADTAARPCGRASCLSTVIIVDDDTRGVTVSQTGTLPIEEGGTAAYTVVLDSEPD